MERRCSARNDRVSRNWAFAGRTKAGAHNEHHGQINTDVQSIYSRLPADGRLRVIIRGANRFTFSDDRALLKSNAVRSVLRTSGKPAIDGPRQLAITASCLRGFFDAYLKGAGLSSRYIPSSLYPEVEVVE